MNENVIAGEQLRWRSSPLDLPFEHELVVMAAIGWLTSCAIDAVISPRVVTRLK